MRRSPTMSSLIAASSVPPSALRLLHKVRSFQASSNDELFHLRPTASGDGDEISAVRFLVLPNARAFVRPSEKPLLCRKPNCLRERAASRSSFRYGSSPPRLTCRDRRD